VFFGDFVRTLVNGEAKWTKVLKNTHVDGAFDFLRIEAQSNDGPTKFVLTVTPSHGIINAINESILTIDSASNAVVGDKLLGVEGRTLSITRVEPIVAQGKYILETESTTAIADGVFVSTVCDDTVFENGGERLMEDFMEEWKKTHPHLLHKQ
jgi:hypothetical protein